MSLSVEQVAKIKGMLRRGDRQSDIAAWFGVNGGRIAEISTGERFAHVREAQCNLPPSGPYSIPALYQEIDQLKENQS